MKVVLINPYELGRQPFALAQPAAWLKEAGHQVCCLELSLQQLDDVALGHAELVAVYVGMHTAARIASEALPRIRVKKRYRSWGQVKSTKILQSSSLCSLSGSE